MERTHRDSSSTATLPRLTSVHVSNGVNEEGAQRPDAVNEEPAPAQPSDAAAVVPEPGIAAAAAPDISVARRSSSSFSGGVLGPEELGDQEAVVLTPSRLRLDSRVVLAHATLQWLTNAVWAVLIWQKLEGHLRWSWWAVFAPTFLNHTLHVPMHLIVLAAAEHMIYLQIGPPPPPAAVPGLVLHYAILRSVRLRTHRVDAANNALESAALLVVKLLFCNALERGELATTSLRLMFTPVWIVWGLSVGLLCFKDRSERMFGSSRDLFFIFLLFVAFKVDDASTYSWRVVFLVPWMWFSGLMLVAGLVLLLLLFARCWSRPRELLLPLGFCCLLLACLPQFVSYIALVRRLDGDAGTSIASILWPNALSWLLMWLSGLLLAAALRAKEGLRAALLARGAVWTAHAGVARRLTTAEREEATRRVEALTEEEVSRLVDSMMAGKSKPGRLRRVGATLYKRIASLDPALAEQAAQAVVRASGSGTAARAGGGFGSGRFKPPSRPASASASLLGAHPLELRAASAMPQLGGGFAAGLATHGSRPTPGSLRPPGLAHNHSLPPLRGGMSATEPGSAPPVPAPPSALLPGGSLAVPLKRNRVFPVGGGGGGQGQGQGHEREGAAAAAAAVRPSEEGGPASQASSPAAAAGSAAVSGAAATAAAAGPAGEICPAGDVEAVPVPVPGSELHTDRTEGSSRIGTAPLADAEGQQPRPQREQSPPLLQPGRAAAAALAVPPVEAAAALASAAAPPQEATGVGRAGAGRPAAWRPTSAPPGVGLRGGGAGGAGGAGAGGAGARRGGHGWAPRLGTHPEAAGAEAAAAGTGAVPPLDGERQPEGALSRPSGACLGRGAIGSSPGRSPSSARRAPAALPAAEPGEEQAAAAGAAAPAATPASAAADGSSNAGGAASGPGSGPGSGGSPAGPGSDAAGAAAASGAASSTTAAAGGTAAAGDAAGDGDEEYDPDNACVICYDGEARCVFLECGHGGFCRRCAHLLFVRPPSECPTCRATIEQVVEVEDVAPVGAVARVK